MSNSKIAFSLLGICAVLLGLAELIMALPNWTPATFPVGPSAGLYRSSEFEVNLEDRYTISFEVSRVISYDKLRSLLCDRDDTLNTNKNCKQIDFEWTLISDGVPTHHGTSNDMGIFNGHPMSLGGWTSAKAVSRTIGKFDGTRRHKYVVEVHLLNSIAGLEVAAPHIMVEVTYWSRIGYEDLAGLILLFAIVVALVGSAFLVTPFVRSIGRYWRAMNMRC